MTVSSNGRSRIRSILGALLLIAGCAGTETRVLEQLDPRTGVTITHASSPTVMYRDMSARSAFGREYVYVGPIQVNKMGQRQHYLWLGIWGTSDNSMRNETMDDFESIVIYADGEPLALNVEGWTPGSIGASRSVYVQPVASALDGYYRVTIDQIRLMAEARDIELRTGSARHEHYQLWDSIESSRSVMQEFLRRAE